ncbi:LacI family DNA-binding transcriptional regulator [Microbacterium allomyrinae]|uniref:LacI family DNA-binding transcriptional regulator n=1 Tax=Microbacterium allomyrinae TaxID=2830666 RepID=A0A9X1LU22_9MICO|nr:LacI family DNA-binding transcriptional regulator [Microbacterium allomyrinae]MCC2031520.1 LacI family DNA-binding transcriptional regulator [Microbacterium allomyrinae]
MTSDSPPDRPWRRPNLYDVAARAGVSHATVSRALSGRSGMTEATRAHVVAVASAMGYAPNAFARALAARSAVAAGERLMRLGVVLGGGDQYGQRTTLHAFEDAARNRGSSVLAVAVGDGGGASVGGAIAQLLQHGVDGLCLIAPWRLESAQIGGSPRGMPTVALSSEPVIDLPTLGIDQVRGISLAVEHLVSLGHRDIQQIVGPEGWVDAHCRTEAGRVGLDRAGLVPHAPIVGDGTSGFGCFIGADPSLLTGRTAVIASNDSVAAGLIHGLTSRGVRVPEEFSVVGFDDARDARHVLPPLTTVRQDFAGLGELAVRYLSDLIEERQPSSRRTVQPTLVVRSSTAVRAAPG